MVQVFHIIMTNRNFRWCCYGNVELTLSKMIRNTHLMSKIYAVKQEKQILTVNNSFKERLQIGNYFSHLFKRVSSSSQI